MPGEALKEIAERLKNLPKDDPNNETRSYSEETLDGINYLREVTSGDETARKALISITQYIYLIEQKYIWARAKLNRK